MANVKRSPWLLHYDGSSCNGCDIEVLACMTPVYDAERLGVENTGDPMQADILLITGGINAQAEPVVKQIYDQMQRPTVVVAVGSCARPQSIIDGIIQARDLFQKRSDEHDAMVKAGKTYEDIKREREEEEAEKVAEAKAEEENREETPSNVRNN